MGKPSFSRSDRLASLVQAELAKMINAKQIKELKDPCIRGLISITEVRVMNGHQHMEVCLSIFEKENQHKILEALEKGSSKIRGELCRRLKLQFAPTIIFMIDESIERSFKVLNVLDHLQS